MTHSMLFTLLRGSNDKWYLGNVVATHSLPLCIFWRGKFKWTVDIIDKMTECQTIINRVVRLLFMFANINPILPSFVSAFRSTFLYTSDSWKGCVALAWFVSRSVGLMLKNQRNYNCLLEVTKYRWSWWWMHDTFIIRTWNLFAISRTFLHVRNTL